MSVLDEVEELKKRQQEEINTAAQQGVAIVKQTAQEAPPPVVQPQNVTFNLPPQAPPSIEDHVTQKVAVEMSNQAAVALQDENLLGKMRAAATDVVQKKVDTVVKKATGENNEASSELEEEAIACFGYKPGKSIRKWQTQWAGYYHSILSAIWMFVAMFTFAPVVFIAKKVHTAAKVTWWGILIGVLIYLLVAVGIPLIVSYTAV